MEARIFINDLGHFQTVLDFYVNFIVLFMALNSMSFIEGFDSDCLMFFV